MSWGDYWTFILLNDKVKKSHDDLTHIRNFLSE